jgi:hypothetical protein
MKAQPFPDQPLVISLPLQTYPTVCDIESSCHTNRHFDPAFIDQLTKPSDVTVLIKMLRVSD